MQINASLVNGAEMQKIFFRQTEIIPKNRKYGRIDVVICKK